MRTEPPSLEGSGSPLAFAVVNGSELGLDAPEVRRGLAIRARGRSLSGMQKEVLVTSSATGTTWRLACDEGPYLAGTDLAPPPLGFLSAGMAASYATEILVVARRRQVPFAGLRVMLDNRYTMEGSALKGTMLGGALPVDLLVEAETPIGDDGLLSIAAEGVAASPLNGLLSGRLTSLFSLTLNGERIELGRVAPVEGDPPPDPEGCFDAARPAAGAPEDLIVKVDEAESLPNVEGGARSSLRAEQSRTLHARAACSIRQDGIRVIDQFLYKPIGSQFRFLSDEAPGTGGKGRAPDAASLISAGVALCFMTQLGRYATITKRSLDSYEVVQDTNFSQGGAGGGMSPALADPVETHVYLRADEEPDVARQIVDMGERTCFLHALCRTELEARIRVAARRQADR